MDSSGDWRADAVRAAQAAGHKADMDVPDSVLMADHRNLLEPGSVLERLAEDLAADIAGHAAEPVTRAACAALSRAAADLRGLLVLGYDGTAVLAILGAAAAKLEMRATP